MRLLGLKHYYKTTDGRRFWDFGNFTLTLEVYRGKRAGNFALAVSSGLFQTAGLMFHLSLPWLVSVFLGVQHRRFNHERELGVSYHHGSIWWVIWDDSTQWTKGKSRQYTWHVMDWLKGKMDYSTEPIDSGAVEIPMPEGAYPATYTVEKATWKRRRWPEKKVVQRYNFELGSGIPEPGKGENDWDMDDTATMEISLTANSLHDAVGKVVASVLRSRYRYGGVNWKPERENA